MRQPIPSPIRQVNLSINMGGEDPPSIHWPHLDTSCCFQLLHLCWCCSLLSAMPLAIPQTTPSHGDPYTHHTSGSQFAYLTHTSPYEYDSGVT